jgi:hypothetical protein
MSKFAIIKMMGPVTDRPFRVLETTGTIDGPRTRIAEGCWDTWDKAAHHLKQFTAENFATHQLSIGYADGRVLRQEDFHGTDHEAEGQLDDMWVTDVPLNPGGMRAYARRYREQKPFYEIGG